MEEMRRWRCVGGDAPITSNRHVVSGQFSGNQHTNE